MASGSYSYPSAGCNSRAMHEATWPPRARVELAQAPILVGLAALAVVGWLVTDERMAGMDVGPAPTSGRSASTSPSGS